MYFDDPSDIDYIRNATKEWNEIGDCNLNFTTDQDSGSDRDRNTVEFWIGRSPFQITDLIRVEPPVAPTVAGYKIVINIAHELWSEISANQKKYLIMHGLGHIIGLKDDKGNFPSIMESESKLSENKNLWSGFSIFDTQDLRVMYPIPTPGPPKWDPKMEFSCNPTPIDYMPNWLEVGKTFRIKTNYTNPALENPTYEYSIVKLNSHTQCNLTKVETNAVDLTFTAYGDCKLIVKILENGVEKDRYEKVYSGVINKLTCDFGSMELGRFYDVKWEYWCPEESYFPINFTVAESIFDDMSGKSATIETVENGHIRIRFNDYGVYTITAKVAEWCALQASRTLTFKKLYQPEANVRFISTQYWIDPLLPETLNSTVTYNYEVDFGFSGGMPERVAADVNWICTKHLYPYRRIIVTDGPVKVGRVVVKKGESSLVPFSARGEFSRDEEGYIVHMFDIRDSYISYPKQD